MVQDHTVFREERRKAHSKARPVLGPCSVGGRTEFWAPQTWVEVQALLLLIATGSLRAPLRSHLPHLLSELHSAVLMTAGA